MMRAVAWTLLSCWLAASGCGDDATGDSDAGWAPSDAASSGRLPADVDAVLERRCRKCHSRPPQNDAPFPLVTWADTQGTVPHNPLNPTIVEAMHMRINDPGFPMPPQGMEFLESERAVLNAWLVAGAKPVH